MSRPQSPEPTEYVALNEKGDYADVMKLRILRGGDSPGLSGWDQGNCQDPLRGRWEGQKLTEAEVGVMPFEDGGEAALSQGQEAPGDWQRQGFAPGASRRHTAFDV